MNKIIYFIFFSFIFISCVQIDNSSENTEKSQGTEKTEIDNKEQVNLSFVNNSSYKVSVYYGSSPYQNDSIFCEVPEKGTFNKKCVIDTERTSTFFFVYNLSFTGANAYFPFYSDDDSINHKSMLINKNTTNNIVIDEISECKSNSSYIFLENNTTSDIYFLVANTPVNPYKKNVKFLEKNEVGVYEINNKSSLSFNNYKNVKIVVNSVEYSLPEFELEKGNVYTFSVSSHDSKILTSLKSITPFNIDTQKKIWSRYSQAGGDVEIQIVKPRRNPEEGYLAACTSKENPSAIIMKKIDVYGKTVKNSGKDANVGISSYKFSENGSNYLVDSVSCIDFVETDGGSCVVLANLSLRKEGADKDSENPEDFAENNFLFTYNFDTASLDNNKTFNIDKYTPYGLSFNSLIQAEEGVFLASGYAYNFEEGTDADQEKLLLHDMLFKFDSNTSQINLYIPEDDFTDYTESGRERKISSVFYSAKDNSYYATEIYDFDSSYNSSVVYKSRLLKFDTSLNLQEVLLEKENMLFSSITGSANSGEYYIAGENYASGVQKGLLISSSNIENGKLLNEPYLYKYDLKSYAWFDSVCICGSNIVVSGSASSKRNKGELPIVVAYNKKGELQWANTNYSDCTEAKSCFSTSIGTYLIHLTGKSNAGNYSTIVSADLLGADTGNKGILE